MSNVLIVMETAGWHDPQAMRPPKGAEGGGMTVCGSFAKSRISGMKASEVWPGMAGRTIGQVGEEAKGPGEGQKGSIP